MQVNVTFWSFKQGIVYLSNYFLYCLYVILCYIFIIFCPTIRVHNFERMQVDTFLPRRWVKTHFEKNFLTFQVVCENVREGGECPQCLFCLWLKSKQHPPDGSRHENVGEKLYWEFMGLNLTLYFAINTKKHLIKMLYNLHTCSREENNWIKWSLGFFWVSAARISENLEESHWTCFGRGELLYTFPLATPNTHINTIEQ